MSPKQYFVTIPPLFIILYDSFIALLSFMLFRFSTISGISIYLHESFSIRSILSSSFCAMLYITHPKWLVSYFIISTKSLSSFIFLFPLFCTTIGMPSFFFENSTLPLSFVIRHDVFPPISTPPRFIAVNTAANGVSPLSASLNTAFCSSNTCIAFFLFTVAYGTIASTAGLNMHALFPLWYSTVKFFTLLILYCNLLFS